MAVKYKKIAKDRLYFLIQMTLLLMMNFKSIRFIIVYVFGQYFFATILTIRHLLIKFDTVTLLRHGSFCGIQIFVLINIGVIVFLADTFYDFMIKYRKIMLPVEILKEPTLKRIILTGRFIVLISVVNVFCAAIAGLGFIAAPEYFNEKTYLSVWIQEMFPEYSSFILLLVHWTSMVVALVMAGCAVAFAYAGCHGIFQIFIMREMVEDFSKSNIPSELRRDSDIYQEVIKQKFVIFIITYGIAMRFQNRANEILEAPLLLFSLGSVILGGSLMIEFFSNQQQDFGSQYAIYIGIFFFVIATSISGSLYFLIGQAFKDEILKSIYSLAAVLAQFVTSQSENV